MGSTLFIWDGPPSELLFMQFKQGREINAATWWDEDDKTKDIFGERDEKTGGTLLACSKRGRVACLVNSNTNYLSPPSFGNGEVEMLPVKFLKGEMSPEDFANDLKSNKDLCPDLTFCLLVADLPLNSMFYISKKSMSKEIHEIRVVDHDSDFHFLLDTGLDNDDRKCPKYKRLIDMFDVVMTHYDNKVLSIKKIDDKLMNDDEVILPRSEGECEKTGQEEDIGCTFVEVKPTGEVKFCEFSLVYGEEKYDEIDFNMDVKPTGK